jgi:hypothetical protein
MAKREKPGMFKKGALLLKVEVVDEIKPQESSFLPSI